MKKMNLRVYDIRWDTSDEDRDPQLSAEDLGLPSEVVLFVDSDMSPYETNEFINETLSNRYGFLLEDYSVEQIE